MKNRDINEQTLLKTVCAYLCCEGKAEIERIDRGKSLAENFCILVESVPRYFVKKCVSDIPGLDAMKKLGENERGFNRILGEFRMDGRDRYIVMEWIDGQSLTFTEDQARQAAAILKKLHSVPLKEKRKANNLKLELIRYLIYIKTRNVSFPHKNEILRFLIRNWNTGRGYAALTHMDVHSGNFIVDRQGNVHLIDYENLCFTDPWRDFVYAVMLHPRHEDEFWRQVLLEYFEQQIPDEFWHVIKYYSYVQLLRMIICEHQRGNQDQIDFLAERIQCDCGIL